MGAFGAGTLLLGHDRRRKAHIYESECDVGGGESRFSLSFRVAATQSGGGSHETLLLAQEVAIVAGGLVTGIVSGISPG